MSIPELNHIVEELKPSRRLSQKRQTLSENPSASSGQAPSASSGQAPSGRSSFSREKPFNPIQKELHSFEKELNTFEKELNSFRKELHSFSKALKSPNSAGFCGLAVFDQTVHEFSRILEWVGANSRIRGLIRGWLMAKPQNKSESGRVYCKKVISPRRPRRARRFLEAEIAKA